MVAGVLKTVRLSCARIRSSVAGVSRVRAEFETWWKERCREREEAKRSKRLGERLLDAATTAEGTAADDADNDEHDGQDDAVGCKDEESAPVSSEPPLAVTTHVEIQPNAMRALRLLQ